MNTSAKSPVVKRKYRSTAERLEAARAAELKLRERLEKEQQKQQADRVKQQERQQTARVREAKARDSLLRKTQKVQTYENLSKRRERSLDTRRKIIVGGLALKHREFDGIYAKALMALIDEYVTRDQDRALFDLAPLPDNDQRRVNPPQVY